MSANSVGSVTTNTPSASSAPASSEPEARSKREQALDNLAKRDSVNQGKQANALAHAKESEKSGIDSGEKNKLIQTENFSTHISSEIVARLGLSAAELKEIATSETLLHVFIPKQAGQETPNAAQTKATLTALLDKVGFCDANGDPITAKQVMQDVREQKIPTDRAKTQSTATPQQQKAQEARAQLARSQSLLMRAGNQNPNAKPMQGNTPQKAAGQNTQIPMSLAQKAPQALDVPKAYVPLKPQTSTETRTQTQFTSPTISNAQLLSMASMITNILKDPQRFINITLALMKAHKEGMRLSNKERRLVKHTFQALALLTQKSMIINAEVMLALERAQAMGQFGLQASGLLKQALIKLFAGTKGPGGAGVAIAPAGGPPPAPPPAAPPGGKGPIIECDPLNKLANRLKAKEDRGRAAFVQRGGKAEDYQPPQPQQLAAVRNQTIDGMMQNAGNQSSQEADQIAAQSIAIDGKLKGMLSAVASATNAIIDANSRSQSW